MVSFNKRAGLAKISGRAGGGIGYNTFNADVLYTFIVVMAERPKYIQFTLFVVKR